MPTFTTTTLDRLIETGASNSMTTARNVPVYKQGRKDTNPSTRTESVPNSKYERRNSIAATTTTATSIDEKHPWVRITPSLYATPELTPLPDSPSSFPPSPYIINHKRRGPRLLKSSSEQNVASNKPMVEENKVDENGKKEENSSDFSKDDNLAFSLPGSIEVEPVTGTVERNSGASSLDKSSATQNGIIVKKHEEGDCADFSINGFELDGLLVPQDSTSAKSNIEGESSSVLDRSLSYSTPVHEFYDAWEELSAESPQPAFRDIEAELREMKLSLLLEIEKRKQVEEVLDSMRIQWFKIREQLALVGIKLPADFVAETDAEQLELDPTEELSRQLYLARFVSNSIGRGTAKAEVEMEMEAQIASKNFEIARLCDRLQYYEAVNREMSQRNQETIETARRLRQRRKRRQRWVWGAIAATITLGSGALAWSYMPTGTESSSTPDSHTSEHK